MLWDSLYYPKMEIMKLKPVSMFSMQLSLLQLLYNAINKEKVGDYESHKPFCTKVYKTLPLKEDHMNNKGSGIVSHNTEKFCIAVIKVV